MSAAVIEGGRSVWRILAGLDWVLSHGVRVVLLPVGMPAGSPVLDGALEALARNDVLVVAPVGNGGSGAVGSPADRPGVVSVGALEPGGTVARFSGGRRRPGHPALPDIVEIGVNLETTAAGGGYTSVSGTSMAAATVAGLAATLRATRPDVTAPRVRAALRSGATAVPGARPHRSGAGRVDLQRALAALDSPWSPVPDPPPGSVPDEGLILRLSAFDPSVPIEVVVAGRNSDFESGLRRLVEAEVEDGDRERIELGALPKFKTAFMRAPARLVRRLLGHPGIEALVAPDILPDSIDALLHYHDSPPWNLELEQQSLR